MLRFGLADTVLVEAFPRVALVPLKAANLCEIDHNLYIATIYDSFAKGNVEPERTRFCLFADDTGIFGEPLETRTRPLGEWLVMLLEGHQTYANAKSLVDLLHLR